MLLQPTLLLTVMAVNAFVVPPNNISASTTTQMLRKRTRIDNTENVRMPRTDEDLGVYTNRYTTQQMEQYYQAHLDVLKMCNEVVAESECDTDLFKRLFPEYFDLKDRETVVAVFKLMGDTDGGGKGCPLFEGIDVVDDYPPRFNRHLDQHCDHDTEAVAVIDKAEDDPKDELILCPSFFERGNFGGGPGRQWPTVYSPT